VAARTRLEVILGAILVQNTAWTNAARAIRRLRGAGFLNLKSLRSLSQLELEAYIRPAGFYRQKGQTIRNFIFWLERRHGGALARLFRADAEVAREEMLQIKGLGPETVDAILLYAGRHPFFVADAYTRRILWRHGLVGETDGYGRVQQFLHQHLPHDHGIFNEFHALLVEVGKRYCRRAVPDCQSCPLQEFLPGAGAAAVSYVPTHGLAAHRLASVQQTGDSNQKLSSRPGLASARP
jgi:endonuclease-3 related protein